VHSRATPAIMCLAASKVNYVWDDATANKWPAGKEEAPFGQMPLLMHQGSVIGQSQAIVRYCATMANLIPSNPIDAAKSDMVWTQAYEIFDAMVGAFYNAGGDEAKVAAWKTWMEHTVTAKLAPLDKILAGRLFFGGDKPVAADVVLFSIMHLAHKAVAHVAGRPDWFKQYPALGKNNAAVAMYGDIPKVVADGVDAYYKHP
jgi:glutathione S-transferase